MEVYNKTICIEMNNFNKSNLFQTFFRYDVSKEGNENLMWHSQQQQQQQHHQNGSNLFHNKPEAINSPRPSATYVTQHNVSAFCNSRRRPNVFEADEAVDGGDEGERGHHKVRRGVEAGAAPVHARGGSGGGVGRWSQLVGRRSPSLPDLELSSMLQSYLDESSNSVNCQNNQTISANAYQLRKCQQQQEHLPESCQENFSTSLESGKKEKTNINTNHVSISSMFYARVFRTKVCSKPNSKQRKDFCT